jgi:hypothetical protein
LYLWVSSVQFFLLISGSPTMARSRAMSAPMRLPQSSSVFVMDGGGGERLCRAQCASRRGELN